MCGKHGPGHPPGPSRIEKGMECRIWCGGIVGAELATAIALLIGGLKQE